MKAFKSGLDYTHPLHRASVAVEEVKFGRVSSTNTAEAMDLAETAELFRKLLDQAGLANIDATQLVDDIDYYARNLAWELSGRRVVSEILAAAAKTVFIDALMHGIALGRIEPKDERIPRG